MSPALLKRIQPGAAGIDCDAISHHVAVADDRDPQSVRQFSTFTADLHQLASEVWHQDGGDGVGWGCYWISVFEILEACGSELVLINARHLRDVGARKSEVND